MKIAVIDLGTNTCNLLIAEVDKDGFHILYQGKELVQIADSKTDTNEISVEATFRALKALQVHKETIKKFYVDKIRVLSTSAVRSASNQTEFLEAIGHETGWIIKVTSGEKEAELIFKGVLFALGEFEEPSAILDIGGGSNEIIVADKQKMLWRESRPTGMARIIRKFNISDPIRTAEIENLKKYFSVEHQNATQQCKAEQVNTLIGSSGAFDTIADIIDEVDPDEKYRIKQVISLDEFNDVYNKLIHSTHNQRLTMKGMDMVRIELIVPAVILIKQLISDIGINKIIQTGFALREGCLFETVHSADEERKNTQIAKRHKKFIHSNYRLSKKTS